MDNPNNLIITGPEDGEHLMIAGSHYRILLSGNQTGNKSAIIEMNVPPGSGPVPHQHTGFAESFYVLEGEVEMRTMTNTYLAKKGAIVTIPLDGPVHSFKNISDSMARLLCIVTPSGLDEFFREFGKPLGSTPQPMTDEERQRIRTYAEEHGQKLFPPDYLDK